MVPQLEYIRKSAVIIPQICGNVKRFFCIFEGDFLQICRGYLPQICGILRGMNMRAIGAYLQVLRKERIGSRQDMAGRLRLDDSSVERIEKGLFDSRGSLWLTFMKIVNAHADDIYRILDDDGVTEEVAEALARDRIKEQQYIIRIHPHQRHILEISERLSSDPVRYGRWIGFGEALIRESPGTSEGLSVPPSD
jgi:DNA-binding XRE family transcriptional regulator